MEQIFLLTSGGGTQFGDWVAVVSGVFVESPLDWTVGVLCCRVVREWKMEMVAWQRLGHFDRANRTRTSLGPRD